MKINNDRQCIIRKNESSDGSADICVSTNTEKGTITIETRGGGGDWTCSKVEFPKQFLDDVIGAMESLKMFIADLKED